MEFKDYIKEAYEYMYWATLRYFAVAEGLSEEQLHRLQGHSWGDVHATLVHMMSSEWMWLQRAQGLSPRAGPTREEYPTLAALKQRWSELQAEVRAFIDAQTEQSFQTPIAYTNTRGETFHVPMWQMLAQVVNHQTHHRGELAAMFALMNVAHPEEEMIQYFLSASGQKAF
jgi:uncharacterized damage-inducible protein DinB